jgi:hypothetical protein
MQLKNFDCFHVLQIATFAASRREAQRKNRAFGAPACGESEAAAWSASNIGQHVSEACVI